MNANDDENSSEKENSKPSAAGAKAETKAAGTASVTAGTVSQEKQVLSRTITQKLRLFIYSVDIVTVLQGESSSQSFAIRNYHLAWKFAAVVTLSISLVATATYGAPAAWHKLTSLFKAHPTEATISSPLPGLLFVGQRQVSVTHSNNTFDTHQNVSIPVPVDNLDSDFRQTNGTSFSGGGADTNLTFGDIPAGLYVQCDGSVGGEKRWAVLRPYDNAPILTGDGSFTLGLYADSGSNFLDSGTATTRVLVWYMPRQDYIVWWTIGFTILCFALVILFMSLVSRIAYRYGKKAGRASAEVSGNASPSTTFNRYPRSA